MCHLCVDRRTERPEAQRYQVAVEQRKQQTYHPGMVDQSEKRTRQTVLVCAGGQNVFVLQVVHRHGKQEFL